MKTGVIAALLTTAAVAQQVQFTPYATRAPESFAFVGTTIVGIAAADLDGDGRTDLAVAETSGLRIHLATAIPGQWQAQLLPLANGGTPGLLDFDGDGDLDILLVPRDPGHPAAAAYARNAGGGSFVVAGVPADIAGVTLQALTWGDVDADGDIDLLAATTVLGGRPSLMLLRNGGLGTYVHDPAALPQPMPFALWPHLVDVDGDQDLDIVATTPAGPSQLLRNVGGAYVQASGALPSTHIGYVTSAVGDFDGDGAADVAATWWNGDLEVFWGGAGGFTLQTAVLPAMRATTLVTTDLDADGRADLLWQTNQVPLASQRLSSIAFAPDRSTRLGELVDEAVAAHALADLDGNGALDVVFATAAIPTRLNCWFDLRPGNDDAGVLLGLQLPAGGRVGSPLAGDVDGDARTDLLFQSSAGLYVAHGSADGRYAITLQAGLVGGAHGLDHAVLTDLDRDGDLDLAIANDVEIVARYNDGTGTFTAGYTVPAAGTGPDGMRVVDLDGDGLEEIVRAGSGGVLVCHNLGGTFAAPALVPLAALVRFVTPIDVDGDGDLDLVTDSQGTGGQIVLINQGALQFAAGPTLDLGPANTAAAFDADGDGDDDLLVGGTLRLLRNDGGGVFTNVTLTSLPPINGLTADLGVGDFDEDGDVDVFLATRPATLLLNDSTGHFTPVTTSRVQLSLSNSGWQKVTVADIDADGDLDLLGGTQVSAGEPQFVLVDNLRQLRSLVAPRTGGVATFDLATGFGFGPTGIGLLGLSFAQSPAPLPLPGIGGHLQLDPTLLTIEANVPVSPAGSSSILLPVPASPSLRGLDFWLQGAILPFTGQPTLTNAVFERIVW